MASFIDMSWKVDEDRRKRAAAAGTETTDQRPNLQRLSLGKRVRGLLRPERRRKRAVQESGIAQRHQEHMNAPTEPRILSSDEEGEEKPLPSSHIHDIEEITALPPMPGQHRTMPARRLGLLPSPAPSQDGMEESSLEDLTDQALDDALAAADSPGNRNSTRPALPAEWMIDLPRPLRTAMSDSSLRVSSRQAGLVPLPLAVYLPGSVPLPGFAEVEVVGSRPVGARGEEDGGDDREQDTPASGMEVGGGHAGHGV